MKKLIFLLLAFMTFGSTLEYLPVWAQEFSEQVKGNRDMEELGPDREGNHPLVFLAIKELPPMSYVREGEQVGIIVDIAEAIKGQFSHPVSLKYMDWSQAQEQLVDGDADALFHINPSEKRKKLFDFSDGLLESEFSIFVREADKDVYSVDDLRGLEVGVLNKGLAFNLLKSDSLINLVTFPDILPGYYSLKNGELDAVVMERQVGVYLLAENKIRGIKITGEPIDRSYSAIAVKKGNTKLLEEIDKVLAVIKEDGTYEKIIAKWEPKEVVFQTKEQFRLQNNIIFALSIVSGIGVLIVLLILGWNKSLATKVAERTEELNKNQNSLLLEIAERKNIEQELRESRDFLKNLTNSIGDVVFSIKMPERELEWISDPFRVLGYTPDECLGKRTDFFYANKSDYLGIGEKLAQASIVGKDLITAEADLKRKNGEIFAGEANLTLVRVNKEVVSLIGTLRDISARKLAEDKIMEYQKRLQALASQLTIAEERERRSISLDLHDNVAQSLALMRMQVASVQKNTSEPLLGRKLEDISETLLHTLHDTRNLMSDLSSPSMNELGLSAAIAEWVEVNIVKRYNLKAEFADNTQEHGLDFLKVDLQVILFRNVRELLINIVKHAQAENVSVNLGIADNELKITVTDDGIGFDSITIKRENGMGSSFGLFSIKERMSDAGGTFDIISEPNKGCTAIMTIPVAMV